MLKMSRYVRVRDALNDIIGLTNNEIISPNLDIPSRRMVEEVSYLAPR